MSGTKSPFWIVDELVRRCDRSGYPVEIGEGGDRFRQVYVNDPFGNRIEFLEMNDYYKEDLAYIHDVGYGDYASESAPGILNILTQNEPEPSVRPPSK